MRFKIEQNYITYVFYICLTAVLVFISYNIIFHIDMLISGVLNFIGALFRLLAPVITGSVIAYLLYPLANLIRNLMVKKLKMGKNAYLLSVILTYLTVLLLIVLLIYGLYALIGGQITGNKNISVMIASISGYLARYNEFLQFINTKITESGLSVDLKSYLNQAVVMVSKYVTASANNIFQFSKGFGSVILNGFIGLFISFYLLKDFEMFKRMYFKLMDLFVRKDRLSTINSTLKEINVVISKFVRGQILDGLIVGLLSSIGLTIIGLDFAFLIGFTAGIANIIPYVGPIAGCIPAVIVGLLSDHPLNALWAVLVFMIVQQLDGAVIAPKVVGDSLGLHPVFIIMAVSIGGSLWGIPGMLLSVPAAGIIKLFILKYIRKKEEMARETSPCHD